MSKYVYIHIPFCLSKCSYCSFISFENAYEHQKDYFRALQKEIKVFFDNNNYQKLRTLYLGGGTPSIVPIEHYESLLEPFEFENDYEFTFEINPKTVDKDYLLRLKDLGVNRLSIGVQSFDNKLLQLISRSHDVNDARKCFSDARECGFDNISIDLIYGLPSQTLEILTESLERAISLDPDHISIYGLKIEEGSKFFDKTPDNLPNEDDCADMYLEIVEKLENSGFNQYEISNFAKADKWSRHNMNYWNNNEYLGFGLGAHGYFNQVRYSHETTLESYISDPFATNKTKIAPAEKAEDEIILNLRTKNGINLVEFKQKYGIDFLMAYKSLLEKYKEFFEYKNSSINLTTEGFLVSNYILSEFLNS